MSFLTLCQKALGLARADVSALRSAPTTVVSQTGVAGEIVAFVGYAYADIQKEESEWAFMVKQGTFNTSSSTRVYSRATIQGTITDYDRIVPMSIVPEQPFILCYLTATGIGDSTKVNYIPYEYWRGHYDLGTRSSGKPQYYTVKPNQDVEFDPTPDATYTVVTDYRRTLHTLSANDDEPIIPSKHQDAIVWKALEYYCTTRDGTTELFAKVRLKLSEEMGNLRAEQLPQFTIGLDSLYA